MRYLLTLFFALVFTLGNSQKSYFFEWVSKIPFTDVIYPGKKHVFLQYCIPSADSLASNGRLTFWNSSIGDIKNVTVAFLVKDTILLSTELITKDIESTKALDKKVGEITAGISPFVHYGEDKTFYKVFLFNKDGVDLIMYYEYNQKFKKAKVLIVPKRST